MPVVSTTKKQTAVGVNVMVNINQPARNTPNKHATPSRPVPNQPARNTPNKHATPSRPVPNQNKGKSTDLGVLAAGAAEMHELVHPKGYKVPNEQKHMMQIAAVARAAYAEHEKLHPNDHNKQHLKDLGALAAAMVEMKPRGK